METQAVPRQMSLFLPALNEPEMESFDIHIFYGVYSLFLRKKFFKGEKWRKEKIKTIASQHLIDALKDNCDESKKVAESIEKNVSKRDLFKFKIKSSGCGFPKYNRTEEKIRWSRELGFFEKNNNGGWMRSNILKLNGNGSEIGKEKRKELMKGLQLALISEIGDIRYSYLAITSPDTAYIGLDSMGKQYYDTNKLEKIFFEMDLLKALAMSMGYNYRNIPTPDAFLLKWL